jgi:hypothetical protein
MAAADQWNNMSRTVGGFFDRLGERRDRAAMLESEQAKLEVEAAAADRDYDLQKEAVGHAERRLAMDEKVNAPAIAQGEIDEAWRKTATPFSQDYWASSQARRKHFQSDDVSGIFEQAIRDPNLGDVMGGAGVAGWDSNTLNYVDGDGNPVAFTPEQKYQITSFVGAMLPAATDPVKLARDRLAALSESSDPEASRMAMKYATILQDEGALYRAYADNLRAQMNEQLLPEQIRSSYEQRIQSLLDRANKADEAMGSTVSGMIGQGYLEDAREDTQKHEMSMLTKKFGHEERMAAEDRFLKRDLLSEEIASNEYMAGLRAENNAYVAELGIAQKERKRIVDALTDLAKLDAELKADRDNVGIVQLSNITQQTLSAIADILEANPNADVTKLTTSLNEYRNDMVALLRRETGAPIREVRQGMAAGDQYMSFLARNPNATPVEISEYRRSLLNTLSAPGAVDAAMEYISGVANASGGSKSR